MEHDTFYAADRRELLPFMPGDAGRVLDIGCGAGGFGRTLLEERPGTELVGVEAEPAMARAAQAAGYSDVVAGPFPDAAAGLQDHSFDTVLMLDVLEHMFDPAEALTAVQRLLAPGGRVIASIPNARHFRVWLPLLSKGRWDYTDSGLMDRTHIRWFTRQTMVEMFEQCGWTVGRCTGINRSSQPDGSISDTPKVRALSRLTGRRADPFLHVQYVVLATPSVRGNSVVAGTGAVEGPVPAR